MDLGIPQGLRPGMSSHQRAVAGETDVWLTPRPIIDLLGPFDLDPCAATDQPWRTADTQYTVVDDGLSKPWRGMVWCNPPYSQARLWLERMANHDNGIALIFARTETVTFHEFVWMRCSALLFPRGRLYFVRGDGQRADNSRGSGNAGAPSVFVAYGQAAAERLHRCKLPGMYVAGHNLQPFLEQPPQQRGIFDDVDDEAG